MPWRLFVMTLLAGFATAAEPRLFSSGPTRVSLLELYTSEGCSSCPSAENWLGRLRDDAGLWRDFVPVAFHVNYWDRLGWPDRFASREFTDRQYAYAAAWKADTVYTPGFVLNGQDWGGHPREKPAAASGFGGKLSAEITGSRCRVTYALPHGTTGEFEAHVALLGGGIVSEVKAGENRGATLRHEFVALGLERRRLDQDAADFSLPEATPAGVTRRAVAIWVTRRGATEPLQATGGWLD
ncbi:MAG TPA: DUF1223 domain-containing protein [Lacunisphaera sp.]|nr:DUF1223 domain-containing protein [Lacunisphaera sp.]